MAQKVYLELVLLFLTVFYPKRITSQRFNGHRYHPVFYSSEESFEMSSESLEGGYGNWRSQFNRFFYKRFAEYIIVNENYIRPLTRFGGPSLFGADMHFFGTFAGSKYFIIRGNPNYNIRAISLDGVMVSENRLKKLYGSGKAPQRLPLVYVGQRLYEEFFLIDKSHLDTLVSSQSLKTTGTTATPTATRSVPSRTVTVPSRDGGIPGRNSAQFPRLFRG